MYFHIFIGLCFSTLLACAHRDSPMSDPLGMHPLSLKRINSSDPITLELNHTPGRVEVTKYYNHTLTKKFEDHQLVRETSKILKFEVENSILRYDREKKLIETEVKTLSKQGSEKLAELGFPEPGQVLPLSLKLNSIVEAAGNLPKHSVFYVRPVPLPTRPVKVGDTWELTEKWLSASQLLPLQLNLIVVFKNLYHCGHGDQCADLELSGASQINQGGKRLKNHHGKLKGRMLYATKAGTVVWSNLKTRDYLNLGSQRIVIESCMASRLVIPKNEVWGEPAKAAHCEP